MVLSAALVGGFAARLLKLPVLVGYLLAGVAIGPHTPGLLADEETVQNVANVGVILLMFGVGLHFSLRDLMSVRRSENVWVDHNTFSDGDNPDSAQPVHFGRPYQVHDGALDITHTASLVTVSHNRFTGRDKVMLIGSSNTVGPDVGRPGASRSTGQCDVVHRPTPFDGTPLRALIRRSPSRASWDGSHRSTGTSRGDRTSPRSARPHCRRCRGCS